MSDITNWPFVAARWFQPVPLGGRRVRVVVIHAAEADETTHTARDVARYFATLPETHKASAHIVVDDDLIVQCVHDHDVAYAAPGCNRDGVQIELAGYSSQSRAQWLDAYGRALLDRAASATAQYCFKYGLPPVHLTNEALQRGDCGIVGHVQVTQVYRQSDHTDPGANFPWDYFMARVCLYFAELSGV